MSYHIIHDKQFIKVKDRFICMFLGGDNNLIETATGRTVRSWYAASFNGTVLPTKEDILKDTERRRNGMVESYEGYTDNGFLSYSGLRIGNRSTYNQYKSFLLTAMKKAITLEQLDAMGEWININFYHGYNNQPQEKDGIKSFTLTPTNEEEVIDTYEANKDKYNWIAAKFGRPDEQLAKRARNKYFPRKRKNANKERVLVDSYWTIMVDDMYFHKNLRNGFRYSFYTAKYKLTKKEAEKKLKALVKKYPNRGFSIKEIKEPAHIYV